jgi:small subunit ribosomal protein S1
VMRRGDTVDVVVLGIDKENRRISLGHKQVSQDPWPDLQLQYAVNTETMGTIARLLDRGVIVNLPGEVEGFVPTYHLNKPDISRPSDAFAEGEELPLRVIEFDSHNRRIVLSVNAYFAGKEQKDIEEYLAKHPTKTVVVAEIVGAADESLTSETEPATARPEPETTMAESASIEAEKAPEVAEDAKGSESESTQENS